MKVSVRTTTADLIRALRVALIDAAERRDTQAPKPKPEKKP